MHGFGLPGFVDRAGSAREQAANGEPRRSVHSVGLAPFGPLRLRVPAGVESAEWRRTEGRRCGARRQGWSVG